MGEFNHFEKIDKVQKSIEGGVHSMITNKDPLWIYFRYKCLYIDDNDEKYYCKIETSIDQKHIKFTIGNKHGDEWIPISDSIIIDK